MAPGHFISTDAFLQSDRERKIRCSPQQRYLLSIAVHRPARVRTRDLGCRSLRGKNTIFSPLKEKAHVFLLYSRKWRVTPCRPKEFQPARSWLGRGGAGEGCHRQGVPHAARQLPTGKFGGTVICIRGAWGRHVSSQVCAATMGTGLQSDPPGIGRSRLCSPAVGTQLRRAEWVGETH